MPLSSHSASIRLATLHSELGIPANYASARGLSPHDELPTEQLTAISRSDDRVVDLAIPAAKAWRKLHASADTHGVILLPLSGFRSIERQADIIRSHRRAGRSMDELLRSVAAPGFSEHRTGRAIDIGTPESATIDATFATTTAFRWLTQHAGKFGFVMTYPNDASHPFVFEPWHWCWHPRADETTVR